jgi:hypothetical protein
MITVKHCNFVVTCYSIASETLLENGRNRMTERNCRHSGAGGRERRRLSLQLLATRYRSTGVLSY